MQVKCEYCGNLIDDNLEKCPNCGASNINMHRAVDHTPRTIEELKQWYIDRKLPPYEITRFFIGINYTEPKAFGIYEENGEFIVYKNKADGSRAIRYRGTDEDYAVNELYLKLKSEILNQKANQNKKNKVFIKHWDGNITEAKSGYYVISMIFKIITVLIFGIMPLLTYISAGGFLGEPTTIPMVIFISLFLGTFIASAFLVLFPNFTKKIHFGLLYLMIVVSMIVCALPNTTIKYYKYNDNVYVHSGINRDTCWYTYDDDYDDYYSINSDALPVTLYNSYPDYEYDYNGSWNNNIIAFEDSDYYEANYSFESSTGSSDSNYDWDSGSDWDSGGTDWGSDW